MILSTIDIDKMNNKELLFVCGKLQIAKNYGSTEETFEHASGRKVTIKTEKLKEFQDRFNTYTNSIKTTL